jgi:hypothetical protein
VVRTANLLLGAFVVLLAATPSASAGQYEVWSCADVRYLTYEGTNGIGWAPGWRPIGTQGAIGWTNCPVGGPSTEKAIAIGSYAAIAADSEGSQIFEVPAGVVIDRVRIWRDIKLTTPRVYAGFDYGIRTQCSSPCRAGLGDKEVATGDPFAAARLAEFEPVYARNVFRVYVGCSVGDACATGSDTDYVRVYAAQFGLTDARPPVITGQPTGTLLATGKPLAGAHVFQVAATDEGSGISAFALEVDGTEVQRWAVATTRKPCAAPFYDPTPCSPDAAGAYGFDTATLADGRHSVRIKVIDASGNETRSDPVEVVTENRGTSCGSYGGVQIRARFARGSRRVAKIRYGRRATLRGRLFDAAGQPMAGTPPEVVQTLMHSGAEPKVTRTVVTDGYGRVRVPLAPGPSRKIRLGLSRGQGLGGLICSPPVRLHVAAGVQFSVRPRRVSANGRIRFAGRLRGGPNRKGVQIAIYAVARRGRARVPVEILRTDARGRFRFAYRFRRSFAPFTYRFRARVPRQASYPYVTGWSRTVVVRVVRR